MLWILQANTLLTSPQQDETAPKCVGQGHGQTTGPQTENSEKYVKRLLTSSAASIVIGLASIAAMQPAEARPAEAHSAPSALLSIDDFEVFTTDSCGEIDFIDYGEGAPGNGPNDDYTQLWNNCSGDPGGIMAYAWEGSAYLGSKYIGRGSVTVLWDPFGNVPSWTDVGLKVCKVDGSSGANPRLCDSATQTIIEG